MNEIVKPYKKDLSYSYTAGAYATIEMLGARPEAVRCVYIHSSCCDSETTGSLCEKAGIPVIYDDRVFNRINQKENTYILGIFDKYTSGISSDRPHIALINPADRGNLGTIIRTIAGLNLPDLAVITPAADIWHPKTVRASMGALFRIRFEHFSSFEAYMQRFPEHCVFPFMLDGETELDIESCPKKERFTLVFGNEATGLGAEFGKLGTSIRIRQSGLVDSLNISAAVGIGSFVFAAGNGLI